MTFLVDTNIFLEILLGRAKKESCKGFLEKNMGELSITDFSLDSIDVILFRYHKKALFDDFIKDVMPKVDLLSLPLKSYPDLLAASKSSGLDFDDAYQYCVTECYGLKLATLDSDFRKVKDFKVLFL